MDPAWLAARLGEPGVTVVDLRWREDGSGREGYEAGHIPGAVHLDWTTDLSDPDGEHAFMLAPPERFAEVLGGKGIGPEDTVVAYADGHGSGPFRLWWACRVHGRDQVRILDGGLERWTVEGRPVEPGYVRAEPRAWIPGPTPLARPATADDVLAARHDPAVAVLDARPSRQFRGETVWFETGDVPADDRGIAHTPRGDLPAGRVPWSANVPWYDLYAEDGTLLSVDRLRERFAAAGVILGTRVVTYCGVGISASALTYALHRAGIEADLYDASWEEWGRSGSPIERGPAD